MKKIRDDGLPKKDRSEKREFIMRIITDFLRGLLIILVPVSIISYVIGIYYAAKYYGDVGAICASMPIILFVIWLIGYALREDSPSE